MTRDPKLGTIRIYGGEKLIEGEDYIRDGNTIVLRNMESKLTRWNKIIAALATAPGGSIAI